MSSSQSPVRKSSKENPFVAKQQTEASKLAKQALAKRVKKGGIQDYAYHIVIGIFVGMCLLAFYSTLTKDRRKLSEVPVIDDDVIDNHNTLDTPYQLGRNEFFQDWMLGDAKVIVNNQITNKQSLSRCGFQDESTIIPEKYNYREQYPDCARPVVNQGNCSSSYAVASASVVADRLCQQTEGKTNVQLSCQGYLSCDKKSGNCKGGTVSAFYDYAKKEGIPEENCSAYTGDAETQCPSNLATCKKHFINDYCVVSTEEGIKREILKSGPVVAVLPIFRDFLVYKEGVYSVNEGASRIQGGQAVKLIGWDQNDDGNYWIVENSWGTTWGLNGFAHIGCGQKSLYIDEFSIAPIVRVPVNIKPAESAPESAYATKEQDKADELDLDSTQ